MEQMKMFSDISNTAIEREVNQWLKANPKIHIISRLLTAGAGHTMQGPSGHLSVIKVVAIFYEEPLK